MPETTWEKRRVGRTNLEVTILGFDTATLGSSRIEVSRKESEAMIRAAWDAGIRSLLRRRRRVGARITRSLRDAPAPLPGSWPADGSGEWLDGWPC
jgi:hypothetical protein